MAIELNPSNWNLENSVALGREGTGLATVIKQPTLKELTTSPYEALARKKAAAVAKPDMSLYKDLTNPIALTGIYEVDKPEFVERVNGFVEKSAKLYADRSNGNIKEDDAQKLYTELAKERNQILSDIDRSKQDNLVYPKYQIELANKSHLYNPESKNYLETEMALPLSQRKANLSISKGDYFDYNKYVRDGMGKNWQTWSTGSFSGRGGGSSKGATEFDENKARASWQAFADAQSEDPKLANFIGNAADKMEKEFDKDSKLQKQYNATSWFDLTDDQRLDLTNKKAEQMAVNISKELFVKNSKSLSRGDRPKDGDGDGDAGGKGTASYYTTAGINASGDITITENWTLPKPKTGSDTRLAKAIFYDGSGKLMDDFVEPTGNFRRVEGKGQAEIGVNVYEDLYGTKLKETKWIPLNAQNKTILNARGYKKLSEVADEATRKSTVETNIPMTPEEWATTLNTDGSPRTDKQKTDYKANYDLWKSKGSKRPSYTGKKNQLTEFKGNKKAGTFDPTSGTINWA